MNKVLGLVCLTPFIMLALGYAATAGNGKTLNVAVFADPAATAENCVQATVKILSANQINVRTITAATIQKENLNSLDVIMFPGGGGTAEAQALGQDGCAIVERFVKNGGGYIGTCAGGFLAAKGYSRPTQWLELVNAEIVDVEHWARGTGQVEVAIKDPTHPILEGFPAVITAQYINGPLFKPGNDPNLPSYKELAVFISDIHSAGGATAGVMPGKTAMLTSAYGMGRCVLFSFHPELTPGLENMVARAVRWVRE